VPTTASSADEPSAENTAAVPSVPGSSTGLEGIESGSIAAVDVAAETGSTVNPVDGSADEAQSNSESSAVVIAQSHVEIEMEITESSTPFVQAPIAPGRSISPIKAHPSILASPRSEGRSPKKVRLDLEPSIDSVMHSPHQRHSDAPTSSSNVVGRDVREITRPRHSAPAINPGSPISTPERSIHMHQASSPNATPLRRSLVQDNIMSSERKRRRSMDKHSRQSATPSSANKPDVVLASTVFPPARIQVEPLPPPPPYNGPHLSEFERTEQVLSGQRLIQQKKDEYKHNIQKFCDKYGLTPGQLMAVVNEMPKRRSMVGAVYWADVEDGLRERYGR
jgi:hypothetical protein